MVIPFSLKAASVEVILKDVQVKKDGVVVPLYWNYQDDGYYYLDFDGAKSYDNGLLSLINSILSISSQFTILEIYNYSDLYSEFIIDLSKINGEFYFIYEDSGPGFITLDVEYTYRTIFTHTFLTVGDQSGFRIKDNNFSLVDSEAYKMGKSSGLIDGRLQGYDNGYAAAQSYFYDSYYDIGYEAAKLEYYMPRYNAGLAASSDAKLSLFSFIPSILGVSFGFFMQLASIEFLGISILELIVAMFAMTMGLLLFKIFLGGK